MSGAIFATDISYPAIIAHEMGLRGGRFRYPCFNSYGGLPFNLESYLRRLEERYGESLSNWELLGAGFRLRGWMDEAEDYWERDGGAKPATVDTSYHNLASWGMTVDDVLAIKASDCIERIRTAEDDLFQQLPEHAFFRTLLRVLNPTQDDNYGNRTVLDRLRDLASDGGIENLIVNLGANNALGTITRLDDGLKETEDDFFKNPLESRSKYNLWKPQHFEKVYKKLAEALDTMDIQRVFLCTVPHVTIAPLARGVGRGLASRMSDKRYFKYYTYYWITDEVFDPARHPHLTGADAKHIDSYIDRYNQTIRDIAEERQSAGREWFVVDICTALERVAYRRYREVGLEAPGGSYEFPSEWEEALTARGLKELTTEFLQTSEGRVARGGLFSLDGIHPTTMGYGLMAQEVINVMQKAGVPFYFENGRRRTEPVTVNFERLLRRDTLVRMPPKLMDDILNILKWLEDWVGITALLRALNGS